MAKLIITRKKEYINSMRDIELFLDRSLLGTISNGKTEIFDLVPGNYKLKAKIDWCGSRVQEIKISDDEVKTIELSAYKHSSRVFIGLIIAGVIGVILSNLFLPDLSNFAFLILIPGLWYLLYYITFGKDDYLRLRLVN